jgi:hypothetical protein
MCFTHDTSNINYKQIDTALKIGHARTSPLQLTCTSIIRQATCRSLTLSSLFRLTRYVHLVDLQEQSLILFPGNVPVLHGICDIRDLDQVIDHNCSIAACHAFTSLPVQSGLP